MSNGRMALIVGINDYPGAQLYGCVNDANSMADVLGRHSDGKKNFDIKLLTSANMNLNRPTLRCAIEKLFSSGHNIALFYFSGHGLIKSTGGYIVTSDFKQYDEGISMDEILSLANQSNSGEKIIILDCCHSGAFGIPHICGSSAALLSDGITILTASRDSESAEEINGSGVFTSLVVAALQGGASDLRGEISPGSIYAYVDRALGNWDQRPIFRTNVSRFTSLRSVASPLTPRMIRKLLDYFPNPQEGHPLNPSYEFTNDPEKKASGPVKPYANSSNVAIMKDLQRFVSAGLVSPVDEEYMYFAAMNSKSCRLTALGLHYWGLVRDNRI